MMIQQTIVYSTSSGEENSCSEDSRPMTMAARKRRGNLSKEAILVPSLMNGDVPVQPISLDSAAFGTGFHQVLAPRIVVPLTLIHPHRSLAAATPTGTSRRTSSRSRSSISPSPGAVVTSRWRAKARSPERCAPVLQTCVCSRALHSHQGCRHCDSGTQMSRTSQTRSRRLWQRWLTHLQIAAARQSVWRSTTSQAPSSPHTAIPCTTQRR